MLRLKVCATSALLYYLVLKETEVKCAHLDKAEAKVDDLMGHQPVFQSRARSTSPVAGEVNI